MNNSLGDHFLVSFLLLTWLKSSSDNANILDVYFLYFVSSNSVFVPSSIL